MKFGIFGALAAVAVVTLMALSGGGAGTAYANGDACGNDVVDVPDSGTNFDFTEACVGHDKCYGMGGTEADRRDCDNAFYADMRASCAEMWSGAFFRRLSCNSMATTYYIGVRLGGWAFFSYE